MLLEFLVATGVMMVTFGVAVIIGKVTGLTDYVYTVFHGEADENA